MNTHWLSPRRFPACGASLQQFGSSTLADVTCPKCLKIAAEDYPGWKDWHGPTGPATASPGRP